MIPRKRGRLISLFFGGGAAGAPALVSVSIVGTDHKVDPTDQQVFTFSACALGTASAGRRIVVGVSGRASSDTATVSSMTIGGVSATKVIEALDSIVHNSAGLWIADVPTGTTGDVVVTFSVVVQRCGICVWSMTGAASAVASDTDSNHATPTNVTVITKTLTIPTRGGAIGYSFGTFAGGTTAAWTNLTEPSGFDEILEASNNHTGASDNFAVGSDTALTVTWSNISTTPAVAVFASWGP